MVTIIDLAQQLSISTSTVSRALSGRGAVSPGTAKRVRALAAALGYQPNSSAVNLRRGTSRTLGVITPHLGNNFFADILNGIEAAASQAGYRVLVCQSNDDTEQERRCLELLLRAQVDGVLLSLARTTHNAQQFDGLRQHRVPFVFFDRYLAGDQQFAVGIDDYVGGYQATTHLLEQGYRRIAHVTGPLHLSTYYWRRRGYEEALRDFGLTPQPEWLVLGELKLADGVAAARQLLTSHLRPDAIFAASDFAALGIMQVLREQHVALPAEMGLVGFSNELVARFTEPALTTMDQHGAAIGRQATHLLLELLQEDGTLPPQQIMLQPTLCARASSVRPLAAGGPVRSAATAALPG